MWFLSYLYKIFIKIFDMWLFGVLLQEWIQSQTGTIKQTVYIIRDFQISFLVTKAAGQWLNSTAKYNINDTVFSVIVPGMKKYLHLLIWLCILNYVNTSNLLDNTTAFTEVIFSHKVINKRLKVKSGNCKSVLLSWLHFKPIKQYGYTMHLDLIPESLLQMHNSAI